MIMKIRHAPQANGDAQHARISAHFQQLRARLQEREERLKAPNAAQFAKIFYDYIFYFHDYILKREKIRDITRLPQYCTIMQPSQPAMIA